MSTDLQTSVSKFRNADFSKASMAMCSMIAAADGSVTGPEKTKIAALISNNETLKIFSASELKEQFDFFCNKMSEIIIQEVRPGLFRIHWVFSEAMIKDMGMYKETFQLCGSFLELSYTISCHLSKSPAETLKYKYDITVQESRSDKKSRDVSCTIRFFIDIHLKHDFYISR